MENDFLHYECDDHIFGKCTEYRMDTEHGCAVMVMCHGKSCEHPHWIRGKLSESEIEQFVEYVSENIESGTNVRVNGGCTPGGIHLCLRFLRHGFKLVSLDDRIDCYWGSKCDQEKLFRWILDDDNSDLWYINEGVDDKNENIMLYTSPKSILMVKK